MIYSLLSTNLTITPVTHTRLVLSTHISWSLYLQFSIPHMVFPQYPPGSFSSSLSPNILISSYLFYIKKVLNTPELTLSSLFPHHFLHNKSAYNILCILFLTTFMHLFHTAYPESITFPEPKSSSVSYTAIPPAPGSYFQFIKHWLDKLI